MSKCSVFRNQSSVNSGRAPFVTRHSSLATRHSKGFTMIELLISLGILALLFSMLFLPMMSGLNLFNRGKASVDVQANVRQAMEQMQRELALAMYVYPNEKGYINTSTSSNEYTVLDRIDIVLPKNLLSGGSLMSPLQPETRIVTYYVHVTDTLSSYNADAFPSNLRVLYRAEYEPLTSSSYADAWRKYNNASKTAGEKFHFITSPDDPPTDPTANVLLEKSSDNYTFGETAITSKDDTDISGLSFQLQKEGGVVKGVIINLKMTCYDSAKGTGAVSQMKQEVRTPNVVE